MARAAFTLGLRPLTRIFANVPCRAMAVARADLSFLNIIIGHTGEKIPILIIFSRMFCAEIEVIAQTVRRFRGFAAAFFRAACPFAGEFLRFFLLFSLSRANANIDTFGFIFVTGRHR